MNHYLDLFLNYLLVEKGLARNTLEAYSRDIGRYLNHLEADGHDELRPGAAARCGCLSRQR